jgi:hypothetical protein
MGKRNMSRQPALPAADGLEAELARQNPPESPFEAVEEGAGALLGHAVDSLAVSR